MGRGSWSSRRTVEDCLAIPVEAFRRWGILDSPSGTAGTITWTTSRTGDEVGQIDYVLQRVESGLAIRFRTHSAEQLIEELAVPIITTPCHFGGKRFWFQCRCGRRVGRLYIPPDQEAFGCRI